MKQVSSKVNGALPEGLGAQRSHPLRPEWSPRFRRAGTPGSGSLPSAITELTRSPRGGRPHWGCRLWRGPSSRSRDSPGDRGPDHSSWVKPAAMSWGHSSSPKERSMWQGTEASYLQPRETWKNVQHQELLETCKFKLQKGITSH